MTITKMEVFEHGLNQYAGPRPVPEPLGWYMVTTQVANDVFAVRPDTLSAFLKTQEGEQFLASFNLLHAPVLLYSPDQVAALRSDPLARRIVRITYSCSKCPAKLRTYAALERNKALEEE